jgi:hypothetical protein
MFDRMGNARRKRLLGTGAARFYTFTQIIFSLKWKRSRRAQRRIQNISKAVRRACLKNLGELVTNRDLKINLIVVRDSTAEHIKAALRDYDSFSVLGISSRYGDIIRETLDGLNTQAISTSTAS